MLLLCIFLNEIIMSENRKAKARRNALCQTTLVSIFLIRVNGNLIMKLARKL